MALFGFTVMHGSNVHNRKVLLFECNAAFLRGVLLFSVKNREKLAHSVDGDS